MKKLITLFALIITASISAQTKPVSATKTFNDIITSISCGDGNCSISMSLTPETSLKLDYETLNDYGKLVIRKTMSGELVLTPDFKGRNVKVTCSLKKVSGQDENGAYAYEEYAVTKIEMAMDKDDFKTATCKAYDYTGNLIYIAENNMLFEISKGQKREGKAIQNKDEICVRGTKCVKVKIDEKGCVSLYNLPNVTEVTANLRIVGDKIYRTVKGGCEADLTKEYLTFKGSKTQIALIAVLYRLGMGH